jgi:heme exporter protein A
MTDGVFIRFEDLGKRYDRRVVFKGVGGAAEPGSVLLLTGPNGSGKSTLMAILTGLLRPTRGTVVYVRGGEDLHRSRWRYHLGVVAPSMALYEELSAVENLEFFAKVRGVRIAREALHRLLSGVGLEPGRTTPVVGFSTGMQQRLKIAQAVLHDPAVLFLDEPGSNLDPAGHDWLEGWVADRARNGSTVVLATNDRREMEWGDRRVELGG